MLQLSLRITECYANPVLSQTHPRTPLVRATQQGGYKAETSGRSRQGRGNDFFLWGGGGGLKCLRAVLCFVIGGARSDGIAVCGEIKKIVLACPPARPPDPPL